jgi:hypothetical protein
MPKVVGVREGDREGPPCWRIAAGSIPILRDRRQGHPTLTSITNATGPVAELLPRGVAN